MRLSEIPNGEEITLEVIINNARYEFKTTVIEEIDTGGVYAEPVRVQEKVLSFASDNVVVNIILYRTEKAPIVWRHVIVETVVYRKNTVYRITSATSGLEENRRNAFRLPVGLPGVAQLGSNRKAADVLVKDVSELGFSLVSVDDIENFEGILVRLVFSDGNTTLSLTGLVVRKVKQDDGRFLYGCKLNSKMPALAKYINESQRRQIVMQKEIAFEQQTKQTVGFGDLRGKNNTQNAEDKKEAAVRRLTSSEGEHKLDSDRYRNVDLGGETVKKKVDYERYQNLKLK